MYPGFQGNPYPKLPGFGPIFLGEIQVHVQKQTKIKMNDIESPKLEGRRPNSFQVVRVSSPTASPPAPASLYVGFGV